MAASIAGVGGLERLLIRDVIKVAAGQHHPPLALMLLATEDHRCGCGGGPARVTLGHGMNTLHPFALPVLSASRRFSQAVRPPPDDQSATSSMAGRQKTDQQPASVAASTTPSKAAHEAGVLPGRDSVPSRSWAARATDMLREMALLRT